MIAILLAMGVLLGLGGLSIGGEGGSAEGSDDPEALLGSDGDDTIRGGGGSDLVVGFAGDDLLSGDGGNDWIHWGLNGDGTPNFAMYSSIWSANQMQAWIVEPYERYSAEFELLPPGCRTN